MGCAFVDADSATQENPARQLRLEFLASLRIAIDGGSISRTVTKHKGIFSNRRRGLQVNTGLLHRIYLLRDFEFQLRPPIGNADPNYARVLIPGPSFAASS